MRHPIHPDDCYFDVTNYCTPDQPGFAGNIARSNIARWWGEGKPLEYDFPPEPNVPLEYVRLKFSSRKVSK